uniref:Uncharacterized protein n=1 Tax=Arundo donax TaxID=35708 RepID=A0A0A9A981_ARUDO
MARGTTTHNKSEITDWLRLNPTTQKHKSDYSTTMDHKHKYW